MYVYGEVCVCACLRARMCVYAGGQADKGTYVTLCVEQYSIYDCMLHTCDLSISFFLN